jgi:hypothetical protein
MKKLPAILFACLLLLSCGKSGSIRKIVPLNGTWQIARTDTGSDIPDVFPSKVRVPGLVDMAIPALEQVPEFTGSQDSIVLNESLYYNDQVYWYKKSFTLEEKYPRRVMLKLNKSMYHTRIYLNGQFVGGNPLNFTPNLADIKPFLKGRGENNELVIAVGCRNNLPDTVVRGDDMEKFYFTPGIYDEVNLILTGEDYIENVQTVPDLLNSKLRVVAEVSGSSERNSCRISYRLSEVTTSAEVARGKITDFIVSPEGKRLVDFEIPMPSVTPWSPENPFLYKLELRTVSDSYETRLGMRTFSGTQNEGTTLLNGKTYYLRGTNLCIFRFFEDSARDSLPWVDSWVKKLFLAYKDMHFNSMRFTIGFPPERWYEIADSLGFLVQDEYPIWKGQRPKPTGVTAANLAAEYRQWMRERWNHACVVIWDGQNESVYDTTAPAIRAVRELDLSNRPWDNGWSAPVNGSDIMEAHPYFLYPYYAALKDNRKLIPKNGLLNEFFSKYRKPGGPNFRDEKKDNPFRNPLIVNEYAWLWLSRDGSPTTVTDEIYATYFPEADTPEKRLEKYAKLLGMETEYWRSHRELAGVMYFCGLSYSRTSAPRAVTSDNFLPDVSNPVFEPHFYKYVRPAFNPVGVMIDVWDEKLSCGDSLFIPVSIINDEYEPWTGDLKISLTGPEEQIVSKHSIPAEIKALGKEVYTHAVLLPEIRGRYTLTAEISIRGESVKSIREFSLQ